MSRVQHHARLASGPKHPHGLTDGFRSVRGVMQHSPRVDAVEGRVVEGERLRVGGTNLGAERLEREAALDQIH